MVYFFFFLVVTVAAVVAAGLDLVGDEGAEVEVEVAFIPAAASRFANAFSFSILNSILHKAWSVSS